MSLCFLDIETIPSQRDGILATANVNRILNYKIW